MSGFTNEQAPITPPLSVEDFMRGEPAEIIGADQNPKILVVWPHGDEKLGPRLGHYMQTERPDLLQHVDYICGNPRAAAKEPSVRYVETDLNRSYKPQNGVPKSYEEKRAQRILEQIDDTGYDYVLDIHTSRSDVDRFFLANRRTAAVDAVIAASPIDRVVIMPDHIVDVSLIGRVPNAIALEYARSVPEEQGVEECTLIIDSLVSGVSQVKPHEREFFYVTRTIPRDDEPTNGRNFELCPEGYYPVIYGGINGGTYRNDPSKKYVGFAATSMERAIL
jgi:Succinylglutamate desuccinylase / Aspartoacylase family